MEEISASLEGRGRRFALVASRFNGRIVEELVRGAADCLQRHGVRSEDLAVVRVPGAWELPAGLRALAAGGQFDGLVALGVVVRGETPHFEYVCSQAAQGIRRVEEEHGIPIGFGLLTCETSAQAEDRAGGKVGNKGWEAAEAALEMVNLLEAVRELGDRPAGPA